MTVSSSLLSGQPLGSTHSTTSPSMLDHHHYWKELSRLVDAFRRVGKLGGKASLTTSTENGLWKASLEIQTNPLSAAQPGPASTPTPLSAAPNQDGAAGRRRPRRRRGPASALRSQDQIFSERSKIFLECSQIITGCSWGGLKMFSKWSWDDLRYSRNDLRYSQSVLRYSQNDLRSSQDVIGVVSRCSQNGLRMISDILRTF